MCSSPPDTWARQPYTSPCARSCTVQVIGASGSGSRPFHTGRSPTMEVTSREERGPTVTVLDTGSIDST